jgi:type IV pilus assembly protein PilA
MTIAIRSRPIVIGKQHGEKMMSKPIKILLIVVGVVVGDFVLLALILVLTVPHMRTVMRRANRTSAIASLRTLNQMEGEYKSDYPEHGFACSLMALGGNPQSGPPTANAAQLVPDDLALGSKAGYTFVISNCTKTTVDKQDHVTNYQIRALPHRVGHTGDDGFCTDETAQIRFDPKGGSNCTELLQ